MTLTVKIDREEKKGKVTWIARFYNEQHKQQSGITSRTAEGLMDGLIPFVERGFDKDESE